LVNAAGQLHVGKWVVSQSHFILVVDGARCSVCLGHTHQLFVSEGRVVLDHVLQVHDRLLELLKHLLLHFLVLKRGVQRCKLAAATLELRQQVLISFLQLS